MAAKLQSVEDETLDVTKKRRSSARKPRKIAITFDLLDAHGAPVDHKDYRLTVHKVYTSMIDFADAVTEPGFSQMSVKIEVPFQSALAD